MCNVNVVPTEFHFKECTSRRDKNNRNVKINKAAIHYLRSKKRLLTLTCEIGTFIKVTFVKARSIP